MWWVDNILTIFKQLPKLIYYFEEHVTTSKYKLFTYILTEHMQQQHTKLILKFNGNNSNKFIITINSTYFKYYINLYKYLISKSIASRGGGEDSHCTYNNL